jgi:holo-[acyl-carrier protein] synthase
VIVGIGIDIVGVERIRRIAARDTTIFLRRVFGERERSELLASRRPWLRYAQHIAAKESVVKALGAGFRDDMRWPDVEIIAGPAGPELRVTGATLRQLQSKRVSHAWLSLSHAHDVALAVTVLERRETQ